MKYWNECEKCSRAVATVDTKVCRRCELGILPQQTSSVISEEWWSTSDEVFWTEGGRDFRINEIRGLIHVANGTLKVLLRDGDTLIVSLS